MAVLAALVLAAVATVTADTPNNTCSTLPDTKYNNTDYADGSGPRSAMNASDCCNQCIDAHSCEYWSFQLDEKKFPGVKECRWAHLTYCCYFHSGNATPVTGTQPDGKWTSGGFSGTKPGPPPPVREFSLHSVRLSCMYLMFTRLVGQPPPCDDFPTKAACPTSRCMWDKTTSKCERPPPPPPPPGPCSKATQAQCGVGAPPCK